MTKKEVIYNALGMIEGAVCVSQKNTREVLMKAIQMIKNAIEEDIEPVAEPKCECNHKWEVKEVLEEIKSPVDINLFIDKEPYIKKITTDKIINLTGQSGSGKTTYAIKNFNSDDYLLIDTDDIFSDNRFKNTEGINKEFSDKTSPASSSKLFTFSQL